MTNPDNIVRVRARNGGRASVYEANGWCQAYGSGILEGTGVVQNTVANMTVLVGGSSSKPDVLIAQNPAGYKIALDLVGQQPVTITAPASNSRISAIVAYTDDLALESTEDTVTGSPASCGLIVVNGSSSASPNAPTDTQIRNAITSDGATGSQASYAIIATIKVASNTTSITDALITRNQAGVQSPKIDFTTFPSQRLTFSSKDITQSDTTIVSYTAPENGLYLLTAGVCFQRNGGGSTELLLWAKQGNTGLGNVGAYVSDDGRRTPVSGAWAIKAAKGDNLTVGATSVYGNIWTNTSFSEIYVTKIA